MADVFVSYSRRDSDFVKRLVNRFMQDGRDVWVDWEDIPRAADWLQEIYAGIEAANTFVFVVTSHSLISEICNYELGRALELKKRIVPLIREDIQGDVQTQVTGEWAGKEWQRIAENNWTAVRHLNWLFFNTDDSAQFSKEYAALSQTLDADLDYIKLHTRLLVRAREWETNGRNPSYLLIGDELVEAEGWLQEAQGGEKSPEETQLHADYVTTSRKVEDERIANLQRLESRTRQFQRASMVLGVLIVGAILAVLVAVNRANDAQAQADSAHQVIATSTSVFGTQVADVEIAQQQVADANATLTPIPPTLTQAADTLAEAVMQVTVAREQLGAAEAELTAIPPTMQAIATQVREGEQRVEQLRLAAQALDLAAASSQKLDDGDVELAALLALQSLKISDSQQADTALVNANANLFTLLTLRGQDDGITVVDMSADGRYVLSGSRDMTVVIWDVSTATVLTRFEGHEAEVTDAAFLSDGKRAISGDENGIIFIWDILTGETLLEFDQHESAIEALALSPVNPQVASTDSDGATILWNADTGAVIRVIDDFTDIGAASSLAFSPDGALLAMAIEDIAVVFDLPDAIEWAFLEGHRFNLTDIVFSPDGETVISGSEDLSVRIWDAQTGVELRQMAATSIVTAVDVSDDGRYIVASNVQKNVQIFDALTGQIVRSLSGHFEQVNDAVFSPGSLYVVTGSDDRTVRVWDARIDVQDGLFQGHEDWVNSAAITSDGATVVSVSDDATLRVWDAVDFSLIASYPTDTLYNYVVMLPDDQRVALAGSGFVDIYNIATGKIERSFDGHNGQVVSGINLSPDGTLLLSAGEDGTAELWDVATGELLSTYNHGDPLVDALFSPDGTAIMTAGESGEIVVWDRNRGAERFQFMVDEQNLAAISYTSDGARLVYGTDGGPVQVIDAGTGAVVGTLTGPVRRMRVVEVTSDGRFVLAGGDDNIVFIWDIETGELLRRFAGHSNWINDIKLTPDGRQVLTASADRSARLWLLDINDFTQYVCGRLFADFSSQERAQYGITDSDPTCGW